LPMATVANNNAVPISTAVRRCPSDLDGETLIGVPNSNSPVLRGVTDRYGKQVGIDLTPDNEALNPAVAISLVASTGGVGLLPLYVRNMLPPTLISRPLDGAPPMIDLVLGYSQANTSPLLKTLLSKIDQLNVQVEKQVEAAGTYTPSAATGGTPRPRLAISASALVRSPSSSTARVYSG